MKTGRHAIDDDHRVQQSILRERGPQPNAALEDTPDTREDAILEGTDRLWVYLAVSEVEVAVADSSQHAVPDEKGSREADQDRTNDDLDRYCQYP